MAKRSMSLCYMCDKPEGDPEWKPFSISPVLERSPAQWPVAVSREKSEAAKWRACE
jgi:hypothetical protein